MLKYFTGLHIHRCPYFISVHRSDTFKTKQIDKV